MSICQIHWVNSDLKPDVGVAPPRIEIAFARLRRYIFNRATSIRDALPAGGFKFTRATLPQTRRLSCPLTSQLEERNDHAAR